MSKHWKIYWKLSVLRDLVFVQTLNTQVKLLDTTEQNDKIYWQDNDLSKRSKVKMKKKKPKESKSRLLR